MAIEASRAARITLVPMICEFEARSTASATRKHASGGKADVSVDARRVQFVAKHQRGPHRADGVVLVSPPPDAKRYQRRQSFFVIDDLIDVPSKRATTV